MASIKDIAQSVGVSISTVSRVLNNPEYKCQTPELRDKIWNAAMKLNYTPNQSARQLKNGKGATVEKTYYINVLMTRMDSATSDPFFTELLHVIESEIHKNGCILSKVWYRSIFSDDRRCRYENVDSVIRRMCEEADGHNDGLIVIGKCNRAALKKLSQCMSTGILQTARWMRSSATVARLPEQRLNTSYLLDMRISDMWETAITRPATKDILKLFTIMDLISTRTTSSTQNSARLKDLRPWNTS